MEKVAVVMVAVVMVAVATVAVATEAEGHRVAILVVSEVPLAA